VRLAAHAIRTYRSSDDEAIHELWASAGWPLDRRVWEEIQRALVPDGLFLAVELGSGTVVGTVAALDNPDAGSLQFSRGGELAYLFVERGSRRLGLGRSLCFAAVDRLLHAGFSSIRAASDENRPHAIRLLREFGFRPFVSDATSRERWHSLGWTGDDRD
jgi:GNAT superfamily N-acetyltransferase